MKRWLLLICALLILGCAQAQENIQAAARGGTIVLKIPQSWLDAQSGVTGVFAAPAVDRYSGEEAEMRLAECLPDDAYRKFMAQYQQNGRAEATVRIPDILWNNQSLIMNQRHFGDSYYYIIRPSADFGDRVAVNLRFFEHDFTFESGELKEVVEREWNSSDHGILINRITGAKTVLSRTFGDIRVDVFREMNTNIAVFIEKNPDPNRISGVELNFINYAKEDLPSIALEGYMDGGDAVYCAVLTEGEMEALRSKELWLHLQRPEIRAEFGGKPYAVVQSGNYCGVVDQNYEFVMPAKYNSVKPTVLEEIFVGFTIDFAYEIFDARVGTVVARLDEAFGVDPHAFFPAYPEIQNRTVFIMEKSAGQLTQIYRLDSLEPLGAVGNAYADAVDGRYRAGENGPSTRLVAEKDGLYWLIDHAGNEIPGEYAYMIPFCTSGEKNVFLVANADPNGTFELEQVLYSTGVDARHVFGDDWRCGLIDQDGALLAKMEYVSAVLISENQIRLGTPDGEFVIIDL